ncbi:restriction endonuclease subunit S [Shewanella chilikensis]|uniref:restriction endonuclease subunit S n=1 Tax=Shewanella chilikensis TaxID=558541 RepID=UPI003B67E4F6
MSADWPKLRLDEVATIKSGKRLPKGEELTEKKSAHPYIRLVDVERGKVISSNILYLEPETQKKISRYIVNAGDVCLAIVGHTIGVVFFIDEQWDSANLTENAARLTNFSPMINPKFVFYYLNSPAGHAEILSRKVGSAQGKLPLYNIRSLEVPVPSRLIQDRIVSILSSFDSKISLNTQTNQTLEQMAQALFKSWFVDFDPVIDNALDSGFFEREFEGRGIPEPLAQRVAIRQALREATAADTDASAIGRLPPETRALFPDRFEKHPELGWIPKGWEVKPVSEALDINPKVKLSKGTTAKFADMKAAPTSGYMIDGVIEKEFSGGSKFMADDVLLARITPCLENGKTAIVDFLAQDEAGFGSTEFIVMRGKGAVSMPFVACLSRLPEFRAHCIQSMVGSSGRQRVQNACFDSFYLTFPPTADVLEKFEQTCLPSFRQMTVARLESEALANLRDTLLPKLLSGELELANTEIIVEAFA